MDFSSSNIPYFVDVIQVQLWHNGDGVGYVDLVQSGPNSWETHSSIDETQRSKGFGILLYAKAINVILKMGDVVTSSANPSVQATRVWNSKRLNQIYVIVKEQRYVVRGRQPKRDR